MNTILLSPPRRTLRPPARYHRSVPAVSQEFDPRTLDVQFASGVVGLREAYDAHGALVYSICRRSLDAEAAKDVTQDVFVSAWRGRTQFDPQRGSLAGWLVGITKRRIIDHHRSEGRHASRRADANDLAATEHRDAGVEQVADRMLVADGLRQLPTHIREIIELAFVHDLTHHEIAERTGTPLGTVKSHIRRGLLRIREHVTAIDAAPDDQRDATTTHPDGGQDGNPGAPFAPNTRHHDDPDRRESTHG
jgi:RNA polymerase sigma-70 factor (ECF subfamily)